MGILLRYFNIAGDMSGLDDLVTFIMIIFGVIILIALVIALFNVIGHWKLLKKAGKGGWEALIPIYSDYVICQISGVNTLWVWIYYIGSLVIGFLSGFIPFISVIWMIISIYYPILRSISLAKSFGKDDVWGIGLFFFQPIFVMILGCGASQYVGPRPMNDALLDLFGIKNENDPNMNVGGSSYNYGYNQNTNMNMNTNQSVNNMNVRYCSSCGAPVSNGSLYCGSCGHKI